MPKQNFNHIAMTVSAAQIDEAGCGEIVNFYGEVFGWTEMPAINEVGKLLVLRAHSNEQFVFIAAGEEPMRSGPMDHFGLSVSEPEELDAILERAVAFQRRDERVKIIDRKTEDFGPIKLHSFYVGFLLPLMVEVQCFEWAEGADANSLPKSG